MRHYLLTGIGCWFTLVVAPLFAVSCDAAPLISGFVDGFRNRFNWRVYADNAPDNPHVTPGEFTYVYWQQAIGGDIPLYQIQLSDGAINNLGALSATGIIPFTGAEPNIIGTGSWSWTNFTLTQGQRTSSLYVTSPHPPGQIGAFVYNCNPIICDIGTTPTIGPVNPPPPLGDYNLGGSVGPEDFTVWKSAFGAPSFAADGNKNGVTDAADYTIWRDHLGNSNGTAALAAAVPEPATALLAAIILRLLLFTRSRWPAASGLHRPFNLRSGSVRESRPAWRRSS